MSDRRRHNRCQRRCHLHCECGWTTRLYRQPPAEIIHRVVTTAAEPVASRAYRRLMAYVDAALFIRPDYGELAQLAATVRREMGDLR